MKKTEINLQLIALLKSNCEISKESIIKAEEVNFANSRKCIFSSDQFGFLNLGKRGKTSRRVIRKKRDKENKLLSIWLDILNDFNQYKSEHYDQLKYLIRKGIPDCLRAQVWLILAEIEQLKEDSNDIYNTILNDIKNNIDEPETKDEIVILRDTTRTYPSNILFMNKLNKGHCELFNVLSVYSRYNKEIGYVSGLNYFAGLFLTYTNEEYSFWLLHWCIMKYNLKEFYSIDFPELKKSLFILLVLLKCHLPKLYLHLRDKKVYALMFASQWFFTFFSSVLKFDIVVRVFDALMFEGFKVMYRISLGLLKLKQKSLLLSNKFEEILLLLKNISIGIDLDELFKCAFDFSLSRNEIVLYEQLYEKKKNNYTDELIKFIGL